MCRRLSAGHFFIKPAFVAVENKGLFGVSFLVRFCLISLFGKLFVMLFVSTGFVWRHFLMLNVFKILYRINLYRFYGEAAVPCIKVPVDLSLSK